MSARVIYLDHNSTAPPLEEVVRAMADYQRTYVGNPASQHQLGRRARQVLEAAREAIARALGAQTDGMHADRLVFTSGGTEANNLALFGLAHIDDPHATPGEAIVSAIEHPSVAGAAALLEQRGWTVHRLRVSADGVVDIEHFDALLHAGTRLVSLMLANNETGVVQPVAEIAARCRALNVPMHTDATQAIGKLPVDFRALDVDVLTCAAHKFHGPLGIGVLVMRHAVALSPRLHGGFQQQGLRPGTECVALAVGMRAALDAWQREAAERTRRMTRLRDRLETILAEGFAGEVVVNGRNATRLPNTSNVALVGVERQALWMALDMAGVACSTGSACASGSSEVSPVLVAMGCSPAVLGASLRFSVGAGTTDGDVAEAGARIASEANRLLRQTPRVRPMAR